VPLCVFLVYFPGLPRRSLKQFALVVDFPLVH
jgi:hypothetical protein